jgi:hypothetical protein
MRLLPPQTAAFEIGLLAFALSNLPFFSSAAGVYGDPFVLIICGISLGSVLAVPSLVQRFQVLQTQVQQAHQAAILPSPAREAGFSGGR